MTDKKPTLCVVAGPNGSGKTTTTVQLLNDEMTWKALRQNEEGENVVQRMTWKKVGSSKMHKHLR